MEIRADGTWLYQGTPIGRPAMVRLFASVLKREDGRFFLVTPAEKVGIRVADAPFFAVDAEIGADGSLTGYAGGLPLKQWLLRHEGAPAVASLF